MNPPCKNLVASQLRGTVSDETQLLSAMSDYFGSNVAFYFAFARLSVD